MSEKSLGKEMMEKLSYAKKNIYEEASSEKIKKIFGCACNRTMYDALSSRLFW